MEVRLVNGGASDQGRLEIFVSGSWGAVKNLAAAEAEVACRQLGFETVLDVYDDAFFGEGTGQVWNGDGIRCNGDEERLADCTDVDGGGYSNDHSDDVGVLCKPYGKKDRQIPKLLSFINTGVRDQFRLGGGGGAEVSCPNILSIPCPKIK